MGKQYCSFIVGELLVGIEVDRVREILTDQEVTPVPLAPTSVHERDGDQPAAHVIVVTGGEALSLVFDAEKEVVEVDPATARDVPEIIPSEIRTLLSEIYELADSTLLLALDPDRALSLIAT